MDFQESVQQKRLDPADVVSKASTIYDAALRKSRHLDAGNFKSIHASDLEFIFDHYDEHFFDGGCRKLLDETPISFRLSKRMTQAAGKATRWQQRPRRTKSATVRYEIAVSTTLLFQTFHDVKRPIFMSGIKCHDRLEALQRVLEHETIHLIEFLLWQNSSCSAKRFQSIANRFFCHTEHTHQLITPRERAHSKFGISPGSKVSFRMDGKHYVGFVNRITKRATVLVEDSKGAAYTDGRRYAKFYVPLGLLKAVVY